MDSTSANLDLPLYTGEPEPDPKTRLMRMAIDETTLGELIMGKVRLVPGELPKDTQVVRVVTAEPRFGFPFWLVLQSSKFASQERYNVLPELRPLFENCLEADRRKLVELENELKGAKCPPSKSSEAR